MKNKKSYIMIIAAMILSVFAVFYFIKHTKNNHKEDANVSISQINLENKEYMESIIAQSRNMNALATDLENPERNIIHATNYEMKLSLDIDKKRLSGNSKIKIKNNTNEETEHVVLRNYSATALTGKNKGDSFLSNFKDTNGNALSSLVEDDKSVIRIDLLNPLKPNEEITITFDFQTDIPKVKNRFGYTEYNDNLIFQLSFCFPSLSIYENGEWNKNPFILSGAEPNYTTVSNYSVSTKTNAFCLGIILCNVSRSFDYLIYPYYPAYTS